MKQLIKKIKTRKIFSLMAITMIISVIFGMLLISILSQENKDLVTTSVTNFFDAIKNNELNNNNILFKSLTNNLIINIIVWLLGISIIGIPIVLIILSIKSFTLAFTFTSIIYTYKFKGILAAITYIIPHILNLLVTYILIYHSISFSITLINYLFRKKECNRKELVTRYLKLLIITTFFFIVTSFIEAYLIPLLINII